MLSLVDKGRSDIIPDGFGNRFCAHPNIRESIVSGPDGPLACQRACCHSSWDPSHEGATVPNLKFHLNDRALAVCNGECSPDAASCWDVTYNLQ